MFMNPINPLKIISYMGLITDLLIMIRDDNKNFEVCESNTLIDRLRNNDMTLKSLSIGANCDNNDVFDDIMNALMFSNCRIDIWFIGSNNFDDDRIKMITSCLNRLKYQPHTIYFVCDINECGLARIIKPRHILEILCAMRKPLRKLYVFSTDLSCDILDPLIASLKILPYPAKELKLDGIPFEQLIHRLIRKMTYNRLKNVVTLSSVWWIYL